MNLVGKNIILTGASSGIGKKVLALLCNYEQVRIVAVARNISNIPTLPDKVFPFAADLSDKEGVDAVFEYAKNTFGTVDIFMANAGFAYIEKLAEPDWKHAQDIFSLNVTSVIYSLQKLQEQGVGQKIQFVATCSAVAFVPLHAYSLYCSSKAALHQFIESYRYEQNDNLTITTAYPVATQTKFFDHASGTSSTPTPWPTQSVDIVARKIVKGIEGDRKRIYPSLLFRVFYPIGRAFPILLRMYSLLEKRKTRQWLRK